MLGGSIREWYLPLFDLQLPQQWYCVSCRQLAQEFQWIGKLAWAAAESDDAVAALLLAPTAWLFALPSLSLLPLPSEETDMNALQA